jgi:superfamily II DNA/RNA helicase
VAKHKAKALEKEMQKKEEKKEEAAATEVATAGNESEEESNIMTKMSFEELGVCSEICEAIKAMGYKHPSKI